MPADCVANRSDCDDITVLNELDGFNQHVSIPFDGDIDLATATSDNIFLVEVPESADEPAVGASCDTDDVEGDSEPTVGRRVGINQIVWGVETRTLHARTDEALQEHARLPSGPRPPTGWPVAILGHGAQLHKNFAPSATRRSPPRTASRSSSSTPPATASARSRR